MFYTKNENNFLVLPDGKTIIGVKQLSKNSLLTEDIITNKFTTFGKHDGAISTLLYDKVTDALFAGDIKGHIVQYKRGGSKQSFTLVKQYGNLGNGLIYLSAQVGRLAFFVGWKYFLFAIDIHEQESFETKIAIPFGRTCFLQVCHGLNRKVYLCFGGIFPEFGPNMSNLVDVTQIYKIQTKETNPNAQEVNRLLTIPHSKDALIKPSMFETENFDSHSSQEKKAQNSNFNKKKRQKPLVRYIAKTMNS